MMKVIGLCGTLMLLGVGLWATLRHETTRAERQDRHRLDKDAVDAPFSDVFYEKFQSDTDDSDPEGYTPSEPNSSRVVRNPLAQ